MGNRRHFHKTAEQIAEMEERRTRLKGLVYEAGGSVKYAEIVNITTGTINKMINGEARPSDRALGKESITQRYDITELSPDATVEEE